MGPNNYTRCFGNYLVKGGYKESPQLVNCTDEPVIADPEVSGPITVTEDLKLLVIATKYAIIFKLWTHKARKNLI